MRTIAVINQKGGCGKTTTSINLAATLAEQGQRTLLVDMDPQGHCGLGLAVPESQLETTIADALLAPRPERFDCNDLLWQISRSLDLAPANVALAGVEPRLGQATDRDLRLAKVLASLAGRYDWCIVDCPPGIGLLTFNALRAAAEVIIPVDTGYFSLKASAKQVQTLEAMAARSGHRPIFHILPNMVDPSRHLSRQIHQELEKQFGDRVLPRPIHHSEALREAASLGQPINEHDPPSGAARDFAELAQHLRSLPAPSPTADPSPTTRNEYETTAAADQAARAVASPHGPANGDRAEEPDSPAGATNGRSSRVADLVERARALAQRTAAMQESLARDPDVARLQPEPEEPTTSVTASATAAATATVGRQDGRAKSLAQKLERFYGARMTSQGALFVQPQQQARQIAIVGDFNDWAPEATPMRLNRRLQVWEACVPLPPGEYRYRLIVDGHWMPDPHNDTFETDIRGQRTSILQVS